MPRHTRYQALIVQDAHVLLITHRIHATGDAYWVIPGGGLDAGETEEECVVREAREETNLDVEIERLLYDEPWVPGGVYERRKSYLCVPIGGQASPGHEPEEEAADTYAITEVRWFDLRDDRGWGTDLLSDSFTYPQIARLSRDLGYGT